MSRNILELKTIRVSSEKVQTLEAARRVPKLKGFELKEEFFEQVYHPEDLETVPCELTEYVVKETTFNK